MNDSTRRLLGAAVVAAAGVCTIGPASAQWGYPAPQRGANYTHAPAYNPYAAAYSGYGQSAYSGYGQPIVGAPAYVNSHYHLQASPYGYPQPYGYGIHSRRGLLDWDNWSPFGQREIEYEFHRNGTVTVDIDD